jgi:hypothetical protein
LVLNVCSVFLCVIFSVTQRATEQKQRVPQREISNMSG